MSIDRTSFESLYNGQPRWEIGRPQKALLDVADLVGLASVLKSGGRFYLLCFSDVEPGTIGPRRVSEKEIRETFSKGWQIQSIERSRYEVRPDPNDPSFNDGGPKAWFVVVGRISSC